MTNIVFYKKKGYILGFEISGHVDGWEAGNNPLCAAISVASQMTVLGIKDELKLKPEVKMSDGYLKLMLMDKDFDNPEAQLLLKTCLDTLTQITKSKKKYVRMEVKENV